MKFKRIVHTLFVVIFVSGLLVAAGCDMGTYNQRANGGGSAAGQ